jgi:plastocyanin
MGSGVNRMKKIAAITTTLVMLLLSIIAGGTAAITLPVALATPTVVEEGTSTNATQVIGNRFFANGTGLAYFSDGAVVPFNHAITPGHGFYYDESTIFYAGDIPEVTESKNITTTGSNDANGTFHDIIIPRGFEASFGNAKIQPDVLRIKVGDTVRWVNEDWNSFSLRSPPYVGGESNVTLSDVVLILDGSNFEELVEPGKTLSIQFTRPGGFHYDSFFGSNVAGTIIVEER